MNPFQNCLELNLKESIKNKLVNHKNDAMIHIFHWITALVYSLINWFKPWKVIRSWKIACEMSEMKLKCLVWSQTDCPFLNPISQSNDLLLQVLSQKKGFLGKFLICFTEKNLVINQWKECWGANWHVLWKCLHMQISYATPTLSVD